MTTTDNETTKGKQDALHDAIASGDLKATKRIGQTLLELRTATEKLREEAKKHRDSIAAKGAAMNGAIERDVDETDLVQVKDKLHDIVNSYQDKREAEAKMKDDLASLRAVKKELEGRLDKQVEGAKQLGLFDD